MLTSLDNRNGVGVDLQPNPQLTSVGHSNRLHVRHHQKIVTHEDEKCFSSQNVVLLIDCIPRILWLVVCFVKISLTKKTYFCPNTSTFFYMTSTHVRTSLSTIKYIFNSLLVKYINNLNYANVPANNVFHE